MRLLLAGRVSASGREQLRAHIDACRGCWDVWNRARWDEAWDRPELAELQAFLGEAFQPYVDSSWRLAAEWKTGRRATPRAVEAFYESTPWYVYNQVIWAASGQRPDYAERAFSILRQHAVTTICDFGCGVGTDGLRFSEAGYKVTSIDLNRRCRAFLGRRLSVRGLPAEVHQRPPAGRSYDALWLMDVVEHLPDPTATLAPLLDVVRLVFCETDSDTPAHGRHPFHFQHPPGMLDALFADHGLLPADSISGLRLWVRPNDV